MNKSSGGKGGIDDEAENNVSRLEIYKWFVAKEKAIYHALN